MKTLLFTLIFSAMLQGGALAQAPRQDQEKAKAIVAAMIDSLAKGDFVGAERDFDGTLKLMLPPDKLQAAWLALTGMAGAYKQQLRVSAESMSQGTQVNILCDFEKVPMEARIPVGKDLRIKTFFFGWPTAGQPGYADGGQFTEEPLSFAAQGTTLDGTLSLPKGTGPFQAVLLVHGSGVSNRDGKPLQLPWPIRPFRDIAAGLASRGIAVYRYDKRSSLPPGISKTDYTVKEEVLDDALAALAALRKDNRINPDGLYVLGHSLGGQLAPWLAQLDGRLAGLISAAGPMRPFGETVLRQTIYLSELDGTVTENERAAIEKAKKQAAILDGPELNENTPPEDLPPGAGAKYFLSLRRADPAKTAAALQVPLLVLQGERDYQVTLEDFSLWREGLAGKDNAAFKSYPGLNHHFMRGEGPGNPNEYMLPGNVAEEVITDIAAWLK